MSTAAGEPDTRPRLVLFDLDGTITTRDTYLAYLVGYFLRHPGRWPASPRLLWSVWKFKTGRRSNSWLKECFLDGVLGGLSREQIRRWNAQFLPRLVASGLRGGARQQLAAHIKRGDRVVMLTASLDLYVNDLAGRLGVLEVVSTRAEWRNERLSGRLDGANVYGEEKLRRIIELLGGDRPAWYIIAYADHYTDLDLLDWADRGVAVCPHPKLERAADGCGFKTVSW